jgi:lipopolysaccharide heptosyltransferase I
VVKKILILKPSSLGDVIHALPVLRLLKLHRPQADIFWWIDAGLASLLEGDPDLTGLFLFERKRWNSPRRWPEAWRTIRALRAERFDWVIDLQSLLRTGLVAWLANGAFTVGLDDTREGAPAFYDVAVPRPSYGTHAVDWYKQVLEVLDVPAERPFTWLPPRPAAAAQVEALWQPARVRDTRWIALQPGARWKNKRWPAEHFAETVRLLTARHAELCFAVFGGPEDQALGATLTEAAPRRCLDLTGRTSLAQTIEWLRRCELMVTNDTGPMHIAAALGKRVIALFGPTDPRRTGPYGQQAGVLQLHLPCVPCLKDSCRWIRPHECLQALPANEVVTRVEACLAKSVER